MDKKLQATIEVEEIYEFQQDANTRFEISAEHEDDLLNPRLDYDNFGKMICFHRKYNLGDKHDMSMAELKELIKKKTIFSLPLFLYDHSGITMSTSPFGCPWDSGQVGCIYCTKQDIIKEFGKFNKATQQKAIDLMQSEVEFYDTYLTGEVYWVVKRKYVTCENCEEEEEEEVVESIIYGRSTAKECMFELMDGKNYIIKE